MVTLTEVCFMLEERFWKRIMLGFVSMHAADLTQHYSGNGLLILVCPCSSDAQSTVSVVDIASVVGLCLVTTLVTVLFSLNMYDKVQRIS